MMLSCPYINLLWFKFSWGAQLNIKLLILHELYIWCGYIPLDRGLDLHKFLPVATLN